MNADKAKSGPVGDEALTAIVGDAIEGYRAGLVGGPMGFVSAPFDLGWTHGAQERSALAGVAAAKTAEPVAWQAHYKHRGRPMVYTTSDRELAIENDESGSPIPLYASPHPSEDRGGSAQAPKFHSPGSR